jgi:GAF domain/Sel1 repeat
MQSRGAVEDPPLDRLPSEDPDLEFAFLNQGGILAAMAKVVMDAVGASGIAIAYAQQGSVVCRTSCGDHAPPVGTPLNLNSGIGAQCLREGKTITCADSESDPRVNAAVCRQIGVRSMVAVPLRSGTSVIGIAQVFYTKPYGFSDASVAELESSTGLFISSMPATKGEEGAPTSPTPDSVSDQSLPDLLEAKDDPSSLPRMNGDSSATPLCTPSEEAVHPFEEEQISDRAVSQAVLLTPALSMNSPEAVASTETEQEQPLDQSSSQARHDSDLAPMIDRGGAAPAVFAQIEEELVWWKRPTLVAVAVSVLCVVVWIGLSGSPRNILSANGTDTLNAVAKSEAEDSGATLQTPLAQLQKRARSGDPQAQFILGQRYERGKGVGKNLTKSYSWYIVAAAAGNDSAKQAIRPLTSKLAATQIAAIRLEVGRMYAKGIGVRNPDYVAAYAWMILAEAAGESHAKAEQKALAASMRPQQILEAQNRASGWLKARGYATQADAGNTAAER